MTNDPFDGRHGPRRVAPPGGADRAITAGRRRLVRRRAATTAAGVSVAVVAGAALAGARDGGTQGLDPANQAPRGSLAAPTALPTTALPTTHPTAPVTFPPLLGTPAPTTEPSPEPTTTAEPKPQRGEFVGITGRDVRISSTNDPSACAAKPDQATFTAQSGFCTILTGPLHITPGDTASIALAMCRPSGMAPRTVTFDSDYEVQINVARAGEKGEVEVWAWAQPDDFAPRKHTVTFNAGDCRTWTVTWRGQDNDGYALAEGGYQVNGYPHAFDWVHEDGDDRMGPAPQYYSVTVGD